MSDVAGGGDGSELELDGHPLFSSRPPAIVPIAQVWAIQARCDGVTMFDIFPDLFRRHRHHRLAPLGLGPRDILRG